MANQDTSISGIRASIIKSLHGRQIGLTYGNSSDANPTNYLAGVHSLKEAVTGFTSAGSTVLSTGLAPIPAYGVSVVGTSGATGSSNYVLAAPIPGVAKLLYNPTTGFAVVGTTDGGANIMSTASNALVTAKLNALGAWIELEGLTTSLWAVKGVSQISTGGIGVTLA